MSAVIASPIMLLFREWETKYAKAGELAFTDAADTLLKECRALEPQIFALPATSAVDFAAKLIVNTRYGEFQLEDDDGSFIREAETLVARETGK